MSKQKGEKRSTEAKSATTVSFGAFELPAWQ
jgi:hypothetical protein